MMCNDFGCFVDDLKLKRIIMDKNIKICDELFMFMRNKKIDKMLISEQSGFLNLEIIGQGFNYFNLCIEYKIVYGNIVNIPQKKLIEHMCELLNKYIFFYKFKNMDMLTFRKVYISGIYHTFPMKIENKFYKTLIIIRDNECKICIAENINIGDKRYDHIQNDATYNAFISVLSE